MLFYIIIAILKFELEILCKLLKTFTSNPPFMNFFYNEYVISNIMWKMCYFLLKRNFYQKQFHIF